MSYAIPLLPFAFTRVTNLRAFTNGARTPPVNVLAVVKFAPARIVACQRVCLKYNGLSGMRVRDLIGKLVSGTCVMRVCSLIVYTGWVEKKRLVIPPKIAHNFETVNVC